MTTLSPAERAARAKRRAGSGRGGAADEPPGQLGFDLGPPQRRPGTASPFEAVPKATRSPFGSASSRGVATPQVSTAVAVTPVARRVPSAPPTRPPAGPVGASTPVPPAVVAPVPIAAAAVRRPPVGRDGAGTLDAVLTGTWHGLQAHGSVRCPVCLGAMSPRYAAGPRPVGGRCRDCGTTVA